MAVLAGIPRSTWAQLESGRANPTLANLEMVAAALCVTIEELVRGIVTSTHEIRTTTTIDMGSAQKRSPRRRQSARARSRAGELDVIKLSRCGRVLQA